MELQSRRHTVQDLSDAIELCFTNGWTDGLPVIPPTADRIEAMLNAAGLDPQRNPGTAHRPGNTDCRAAGWQP